MIRNGGSPQRRIRESVFHARREGAERCMAGTDGQRARPWTPVLLGAFFAFATLMCTLAGISLLTPGGPLDWIWLIKPEEHGLLIALGPWAGAGFLALAVAMAAACLGTFRRRRWGLWLAMAIFAVNAAGDAARMTSGAMLEGAIGVAVTGVILWWLTRPRVLALFGARRSAVGGRRSAGI